ncbi:MAG: rRNA pseudouridine synthase [Oscillospiraceae bacterium]|nr:rRNA pseudouridine synthase [Oscillospiraceae bacterium]
MRIQKLIAARGLMSRRKAEEYIADGRVTVNGRAVTLGCQVTESDVIAIDGNPLPAEPEKVYIMLNKPRGVVCTMSDERGRPTVARLTSEVGARVLPVGRLDIDSEGLLLMTNDNELINKLTHPSNEIEKEYRVSVRVPDGTDFEAAAAALGEPMDIEGYIIKPAIVKIINRYQNKATLSIVIHEGRNRQVRRMCEKTNLSVDRLVRVRIGDLELGDLGVGEWRYLPTIFATSSAKLSSRFSSPSPFSKR